MFKGECECETEFCKFYRGHRIREDGVDILYCKVFRNGVPDKPCDRYSRGFDGTLVRPYRAGNMLNRRMHGQDCMCSLIRDIYLKLEDEEAKLWCRYLMSMSKNVHVSLQEYQSMLVDHGVTSVAGHRRPAWQLRPKSLKER